MTTETKIIKHSSTSWKEPYFTLVIQSGVNSFSPNLEVAFSTEELQDLLTQIKETLQSNASF
jgi:hypothetical protein